MSVHYSWCFGILNIIFLCEILPPNTLQLHSYKLQWEHFCGVVGDEHRFQMCR